MDDKELDNYMKKVNPNFDSHIEKGTIEMSNEYYNLLEEKMARLINQNHELKEKIKKLSQCDISKDTRNSRQRIANRKLLERNQDLVIENLKLNNIIKETKEYLEYQISQLDFYEDTKAKMLGSMAIVFLKGSEKE